MLSIPRILMWSRTVFQPPPYLYALPARVCFVFLRNAGAIIEPLCDPLF